MTRILAVDDDPNVRELVDMYLTKAGFEVQTAPDAETALELATGQQYDLALLDIMLPGMDGYRLCEALRQQYPLRVIFLTGRDDELDPVVALDILKAHDYMTKPFNGGELVARINKALQRPLADTADAQPLVPVEFPQFRIDPASREVSVKGQPVALTPHEFDIVALLARRPRVVISRSEIMSEVWGYDDTYGDTRTVDTHTKRARKKLVDAGLTACGIDTVWGRGYRFMIHEDKQA